MATQGSPKKPRTNDKRIYFKDVVKYDTQWERLSLELETATPNRGWRALGEKLLQKTCQELDYIGKNQNPTKVLLDEWKVTEEAFMDVLIEKLNIIGNHSVCRLLQSFSARTKQDLKNIPYKELKMGERIGKGSFAEVFKATWHGQQVAVKQLFLELRMDLEVEFYQEAALLSQCQFPSVVRLYGVSNHQKDHMLIMEYIPKGSLYSVLGDSREELTWPLRYQIAEGIARGVQYLHANSILHRDLKSPNVLLDQGYQPKLTDFGLSKIKTETITATERRTTVGSVRWMAPEMATNQRYTFASDVYSLGMIFWEIASRRIPYDQTTNEYLVINRISKGEQEVIPDDCPEPFASVIQQCWKLGPTERPPAYEVSDMVFECASILGKHNDDNNNNLPIQSNVEQDLSESKEQPEMPSADLPSQSTEVISKPPFASEQKETEQPAAIVPRNSIEDPHSQSMLLDQKEVAPEAESVNWILSDNPANAGTPANSVHQPMDEEIPKEFSGLPSTISTHHKQTTTLSNNTNTSRLEAEVTWNCTRMVVVGDSGAGKTSFIRWLKGEDFDPNLSRTVGIDICTIDTRSWQSVAFDIKDYVHKASQNMDDLFTEVKKAICVWDFAGQEYNTHHLFFNNAAIYVVVVDITLPKEHNKARIKFWVESIEYYTKMEHSKDDPEGGKSIPIFLVGTHKDCLKTDGIVDYLVSAMQVTVSQKACADQIMKDLFEPYQSAILCRAVVSTKKELPEHLKKTFVETANRMGQVCKLSWLQLYQELLGYLNTARKLPLTAISLDQACKLAAQFNLAQDEVQQALKFYHKLGLVLYFPELDKVFIKPQQLVDVFETLLTTSGLKGKVGNNRFEMIQQTGRITEAVLKTIWSEFSEEFRTQLKFILQRLGLIFYDPDPLTLVIPSLVGREADQETIREFTNGQTYVQCSISGVPPLAFSTSLIAKLATEAGGTKNCELFKDGCVFRLARTCKFLVKISAHQIIIQGANRNTENSMALRLTKQLICLIYNTAKECSKKDIQMAIQVRCFYCNSHSNKGEMLPVPAENICETIPNMEYASFLCPYCIEHSTQ